MKIKKEVFKDLYENRPPERCLIRRPKRYVEGLADMYAYMDCDFETCVEVGTFVFESTEFAARAFKRVYAIDNQSLLKECLYSPKYTFVSPSTKISYVVQRKQYEAMLKFLINNPHVFLNITESVSAAGNFEDESITVVYIDANHTYKALTQDINIWLPKVKSGGYICGHDYAEKWEGVVKAVNERFGKPDEVFQDTSWIIKID